MTPKVSQQCVCVLLQNLHNQGLGSLSNLAIKCELGTKAIKESHLQKNSICLRGMSIHELLQDELVPKYQVEQVEQIMQVECN